MGSENLDWVKVAQALDDESWSRRNMVELGNDNPEIKDAKLLGKLAFMLRDCLLAGMSNEDRDKVFDRTRRGRQ